MSKDNVILIALCERAWNDSLCPGGRGRIAVQFSMEFLDDQVTK